MSRNALLHGRPDAVPAAARARACSAKFDALARAVRRARAGERPSTARRDATASSSSPARTGRAVSTARFYFLALPLRTRRELRASRPDAVARPGRARDVVRAARPFALGRARAGDRSTSTATGAPPTRLYGSPARRPAQPARRPPRASRPCAAPTRCGRSPTTRRRSCARTASSRRPSSPPSWTSSRSSGRPSPLPDAAAALFVGVLELYKNVDELAEAWRLVAASCPARRCTSSAGARGARWSSGSSPTCRRDDVDARRCRPEGSPRALDEATVPRAAVAVRGAGPRAGRGVLPRPAGVVAIAASAGSSTSSSDGENGLLVAAEDRRRSPTRSCRAAHRPRPGRAARRGGATAGVGRRGRHAGGVRGAAGGAGRRTYTRRMRADAHQAGAEERRLPHDRRDRDRRRRGRRRAGADAARAHVPQGQRHPRQPDDGAGRPASTSRWRSSASSATSRRRPRRRARPLHARHAAARRRRC